MQQLNRENRSLRILHQYEMDSHKQALSGFSAVCVLDTENRVIEANPEFTDLIASTTSLEMECLDRALPALADTEFWNAVESRQFWSGDVVLVLHDTDRRVFQMTALPQLSPDGDFLRTLVVMFDRTEEKTGVVDDMLHATLEHLNEDVYVYDADTLELRYMNKEARSRCGWLTEEVRRKRITDSIPNFDFALFRKHTGPLLRNEKEASTIQLMLDKGPVEVMTRVIVGLDNKRLLVSTLRDLTDRQEVEKARMQSVSMISHELRTPLTSIKGALSLLNSGTLGKLPKQASQVLSIANRNSDRLLNVINDILDYEKLASGNMNFSDDRVDLKALVEEALENMNGYAEVNDVTLVPELPSSEAHIFGDADRLMQVLVNLVSNAAKFSPLNGTVTIKLQQTDNGWRVAVSDCGPGIPVSMVSRIGEPFMQFEATRDKKHLGTGLGLTIVKRILSHHDSALVVNTSEGKGSEFAFEVLSYAKHLAQQDDKLVKLDTPMERSRYGT
ncbi:MAG TPA: ATP-binding protein [Marivita sp.]|nr:ATP-binding protein [Marivita sp.]